MSAMHYLVLNLVVSGGVLAGEVLFNGKDLEGWEGDVRLWRVEDGVLIGETDQVARKIEKNSFLRWKGGPVADFTLTYEARVIGDNNSGVMYRAGDREGAEWGMAGYQMDLHAQQDYLGMLYDEGGRGILCLRGRKVVVGADGMPRVSGELPVPEVKLGEWNRYRIEARGHVLRHFVNDRLAAEVVDQDETARDSSGALGLQVHRGESMKVEFRSIELTRHEPEGID